MNPPVGAEPTNYHPVGHKPRVMIIEDDSMLLKMYTEKFTLEEFDVLSATDGQKAYDTLKNEVVDCVLLDLHIPQIDGLSLIEKLRQEGVTLPPVLALTNIAEAPQREKALELGIKEYLVKAMFTPEQVVQKVKESIPPATQ